MVAVEVDIDNSIKRKRIRVLLNKTTKLDETQCGQTIHAAYLGATHKLPWTELDGQNLNQSKSRPITTHN